MQQLTPEHIADLRTDLLTFTQYLFKQRRGVEFKLAWHHYQIAQALERVVIGDIKRLIINIPPRSGKTELAVKSFIAWCMGNFPDSEFIHASYSKRLASANTYEIRSIMQSEAFQAVFPELKLQSDSKAKDEFRTEAGGIVYASGASGTITGYGAGKKRDYFGGAIVIDDPTKADDANSQLRLDGCIDWFQNTMESRKNSPNTPIIVIMQRLNVRDLTGWLMCEGDQTGNGETWEQLCVPALDDNGLSFWPEEFPEPDLKRKEEANRFVYAGQYMQSPVVLGGNLFKAEWWQFYTELPKITRRIIYADTAQKTGQQNDYSVFQCWGLSYDRKAYLIDQIRGKWEAPELLKIARAFWNKQKATIRPGLAPLSVMKIEDKSSGTGLIQTLRSEHGIPVKDIQRERDKVTRAMDVLPAIESGLVYLPANAPWLQTYLTELEAFPAAPHDDQVDPTVDAINDLVGTHNISYADIL